MPRRASAAACALLATVAAAQSTAPTAQPDGARPPAALRLPRGPIKITADRAELEQREVALYRGKVRLVSADLELTGDRLELRQPARGEFNARLSGTPARLRHLPPDGAAPISASAALIVYDTRSGVIEMSGGAQLARGSDTVSSGNIRYDLAARRISAVGSDGDPVQMVIQPPERGGAGEENQPGVPQNTPR